MQSSTIKKKTLARVIAVAQQEGVSVDAFIDHLLDAYQNRQHKDSRYKMLIELVSDYTMWVSVSEAGRFVYEWISGHFERFKGDFRIGQEASLDYIYADDLPRVLADIDATLKNQTTVTEYRAATHKGGYVWLRLTRKPIWDEREKRVVGYYGVAQDVTAQRAVEEMVNLQAQALTTAANAIVITDHEARIEWANPAFTTLTGYTLEEAFDKNPNELVKSGLQSEAFYAHMWQIITSGEVWHGTLINRRKDGTLYDEEMTITPVTNRNGDITHFIAIKQDVTQREQNHALELERERLSINLKKEQEYVTTVQHIIASLEHDIRTPLAVIASSRELLDRYFDHMTPEQRRDKLATIDKQLRFITELVSDLGLITSTSINHRGFNPAYVNLEVLCQLTVQELQTTSGIRHNLHFVTDNRIKLAYVDEVLVSRILLNLISNAIKYSPSGSDVTLKLSAQDHWIILQVIDHGIGIDETDLSHIFEPFYRATNAKLIGGTGLGLNIVQTCAEMHGGRVLVESHVGIGTTFTVELPYIHMQNGH